MSTKLVAAILCAMVSSTFAAKPVPVTTYVLESPTLRLEVSPTYSYKLTEKATGNVLLTENLATFTIGSSSISPTAISNVTLTGNTLDATFTFARGTNAAAHVNFTFVSPDNLQVTLTSNNAAAVAERFADVSGTRYYGVWENALPNNLDNRGISAGYDGKELTTTKDVFASSARAPFYMTNKNYAIYANTEAQGTYSFGISGSTTLKFNSPSLQYNIFHGTTPKALLGLHNAVAGGAFVPPDWALSTIYWRDDAHQLPAGTITTAQALILDDAAKLAANQMHAGAIWIDRPYGTGTADANVAGWGNMDFDPVGFPDPSTMAETLNNGGVQLLLWAANKASNNLQTEGSSRGYLFTGYSVSPAIDLRNPAAYTWFNDKINSLDSTAAGGYGRISGFKIDRGGEGEMPDAVINTQTTLLQKLLNENMAARNGGNFFNFSRNLNGKGRQYAAVWSGDPKTTWLGLQTSVKNGLRTGLVNFSMWGSDTGGYSGSAPSEELFSRWVEFSAYCPMMEIIQGPGRNIFYDFSATARARTAKYTTLHHELIPYTRSVLNTAVQTGVPVMRAMFVEFPADAAVADMADEFMYGPNILVAPVLTSGATSRSVYLPALPNGGRWLDYNTGTTYAGGATITAAAGVDVIPTYVRPGSIVPRGDVVQANNRWDPNWVPTLRIEVNPGAGTFDYYTAAGLNTMTLAPKGTGWEFTSGALGMSGNVQVFLSAPPSSVTLNGITLIAGDGYTYSGGVLNVPVGPGDAAVTLDVLP